MLTKLFAVGAGLFGADAQAPGWLPLLLDAALKGAVILLAAWLLNRLLGRAAAATRHLVWTLALLSLLALPALRQVIPVWQLPLPAGLRPLGLAAPVLTLPPALGIAGAQLTEFAAIPTELPQLPAVNSAAATEPVAAPTTQKAQWITGPRLVLLVWLLGVLVVLARLGLGLLGARRITRTAAFVRDYGWNVSLKRLSEQLRLREHIPLLCSAEVAMPMTCGFLRPVVLVPPEAGRWSEEWRQAVLLHELAHIKRRDCLTQLLAQVACAVYWFNPLVWLAARRLREERELACDDCVLGVGTRASAYASYLLELARPLAGNQAVALPAAVGMGCSQLESRVRAILDPAIKRRGLPRGLASLAVVATLGLLLPLAALQPATHAEELAGQPPVAVEAVTAVSAATAISGSLAQPPALEAKSHEATPAKESRTGSVAQAEDTAATIETDADADEQNGDNPNPNPNPNPGQDVGKKTETSGQELTAEAIIQMRMHGVTPEYIEMLRKQGYDNLSVKQVTQLRRHGVNETYIQEARNWGGDKLSVEDLVQLKMHGVTPEYVRLMKQAGYNESVKKLSQMSMFGVTPEYIESMRKLGYGNLTAEQLTQLKMHGVSETYVTALRSAGFDKLTVEELAQAKMHGLSPDYVSQMRSAGFDKLTLKQLTQMRMHGVSPAFIKEMRELGFDKLTVEELTRLKMFGVDADYVKKMRAAGLKNVSMNDLLKLKMNGIDEILLKK